MVAPVAIAPKPAQTLANPPTKKGGLAGRLLGGRFEVATFLGTAGGRPHFVRLVEPALAERLRAMSAMVVTGARQTGKPLASDHG